MLSGFRNAFKIPDLKRKILITLALLVVYRLGVYVPTPGVSGTALTAYMLGQSNSLFGLANIFSGGALNRASIFALGIMPYISASIILQLLMSVFPYFEKLKQEGEEGKKKINQYTRYGTVFLSLIQGLGISIFLENLPAVNGMAIVPNPGLGFKLLTTLTMTTGTIFIMWLGEQITERGIGNGISLIIFAGIVARGPEAVIKMIEKIRIGELNIIAVLFLIALMLAVTAAVVLLTQGQRKIPIQYPKRVVGRKVYGGQATFLPLKVNMAGVIPIIFAQSIIMFPGTLASFSKIEFLQKIAAAFSPTTFLYSFVYSIIIIFFTYFYTAIIMNPIEVSENMKKYGGFIPGIRPGKKTAEYINYVINRITLPGAIFLALISILPTYLMSWGKVPFYFGGTSLLIVVGVALDTLQQMETHLVMRHYDGFMKKGRIKGRK